MFQPWFKDLISLASDIVVGLSAAIVAVVATLGLSQWRKELQGKARFEAARKIAYLAYQFRDQYKRARGMWTSVSETVKRDRHPDENASEAQHRDEYFARMNRISRAQETLCEINQVCWEAEVLFGKDIGGLIEPLEGLFNMLHTAIEMYFGRHIERAMKGASVPESDSAWLEDKFKIIYGHGEDAISKSADKIVASFVQEIRSLV
jgi:hypothetical protein